MKENQATEENNPLKLMSTFRTFGMAARAYYRVFYNSFLFSLLCTLSLQAIAYLMQQYTPQALLIAHQTTITPQSISQLTLQILQTATPSFFITCALNIMYVVLLAVLLYHVHKYIAKSPPEHQADPLHTELLASAQHVRKCVLKILAASLLYMCITVFCAIIFLPVVFFILPLLLFYLPAILLDNKGALGSLAYSKKLMWGRWWRNAFFFLALYLPFFLVETTLFFWLNPTTMLQKNALHIITKSMFLPFACTALLLRYHDLKRTLKRP